jgi:hypothetical protein
MGKWLDLRHFVDLSRTGQKQACDSHDQRALDWPWKAK